MEDLILFHPLQSLDINKEFYVDVGANDLWNISVTKFFSNNGLSGINIEPLSDKHSFLCFDRPNDININAGIYSSNGKMELYNAGGRSTCNKEEMEILRKEGFKECVTEIPVYTLTYLLYKYTSSFNEIHFLKIDVEGLERQVLEGLNMKRYRPYIITIESTLPGSNVPCFDKFEDLILSNNYILAFDDGVNRYYVRGENSRLAKCFLTISELKSIYEIYRPVLLK